MINILTVCGNGIGSSLMLKMRVDEICEEHGIDANVESTDFNSAQGKSSDLIITINELANQFHDRNVVVVRNYVNKELIEEDILDTLKELNSN